MTQLNLTPDHIHRDLSVTEDVLQVLEFPLLAAVEQAAPMEHLRTVSLSGPPPMSDMPQIVAPQRATPVLIQGAIRRCAIDTTLEPSVYGNAFTRAGKTAIEARTTRLEPPTQCNIYAIEAPSSGSGLYSLSDMTTIIATAFTAFSKMEALDASVIELHVGYWGCGAYPGNHELMILLQLLAARMAGACT